MKIPILVLLLLITLTSNAQRCGSGVFKFRFYEPINTKNVNWEYEIYSYNKETLQRIILNDSINNTDQYANYVRNVNKGVIIDRDLVSISKEKDEVLEKFLEKTKVCKKGRIKGVLEFETVETYYQPYILKIYNNSFEFFILANLFGGCNKVTDVIIKSNPEIIRH